MMAGMKNTTIIEDAWRSYKSAVLLQEIPDFVVAGYRATFFSGAGIVFKALFPDDAPASNAEYRKVVEGLSDEIQRYFEQIAADAEADAQEAAAAKLLVI